ncbi:MAG: D-3-phosphoglycerate dehydrogenase [Akkermansiaceae bacterium]|jgi:D-3-phosphoglycerate dehydrogenase
MGTALGNAKANIANLSLARNSSEGSALTVIELDEPLDSAVMEEIRSTAGVIYATGVTL